MSNPYDFPSQTIQYPEQEQDPYESIEIDMEGMDEPQIDEQGIETHPDGSMVFPFGPQEQEQGEPPEFDSNLAEFMSEAELNKIASDLLRGIDDDIQSSANWRSNLALGTKLLGTTIEPASTDAGTTSSTFEGQHKTTHPLLLEACLTFQANARASLLPAAGPVKIRDDQTTKPQQPPMPPMPMMGHNGGPPLDDGTEATGTMPPMGPEMGGNQSYPPSTGFDYGGYVNGNGYADGGMPQISQPQANGNPFGQALNINVTGGQDNQQQGKPNNGAQQPTPQMPGMPQMPQEESRDVLANALEKDFNHYLTVTDKGYYSDTDKMLFNVGLSGEGIKKVYNCPLKRRPVSESVQIEDFIVSNAFSDLCNMPRITQRVMMRPSTLRRMQLVEAYRDIELGEPQQNDQQTNEVKQQQAEMVGVDINTSEPEDMDYELYECYCELELDQFAPKHFKDVGLALPYKVVIAKDSEKILEIRRNWNEDDEECTAKEYFVDFSYVKAFGFYGLGLMHILGNTTRTLTAAWREFIDSGMFANYPGFLFSKGAGRQLTNNFRVPPGGGVGIDTGIRPINDMVAPLPYHDLTASFVAFIQHVEEYGQKLGGTANIQVGEGRQDAPVGTTLAMIEQATKPLGAVLKRLHSAQGREFQLLKERFKENPEAFWRFNRKPAMPWQVDQFLKALDDYDLVPVSDPNNPTNLHRIAKGQLLYQMASADPTSFKKDETYKYIMQQADLGDAEGLLAGPQPPQTDPKVAADQLKAQMVQLKSQNDLMIERMRLMDRSQERQSKERIAEIDRQMEQMKLGATLAIHHSEQEMSAADRALQLRQTFQGQAQDAGAQQDQSAIDAAHRFHEAQSQAQQAQAQREQDAQIERERMTHENIRHFHKVNTDAALRHHKTTTDAAVKREHIAKLAAAKRATQ